MRSGAKQERVLEKESMDEGGTKSGFAQKRTLEGRGGRSETRFRSAL